MHLLKALHRPLRRQVAVEGFHDAGLMVGKCQGKTNQKKGPTIHGQLAQLENE